MDKERTVLFICEHGSAKSVVAAAHFNRLAIERQIGLQAVSRGTNPDDAIVERVVRILDELAEMPREAVGGLAP